MKIGIITLNKHSPVLLYKKGYGIDITQNSFEGAS